MSTSAWRPRATDLLDEPKVHLGLAAAGDAVEHERAEFFEVRLHRLHRAALLGVQDRAIGVSGRIRRIEPVGGVRGVGRMRPVRAVRWMRRVGSIIRGRRIGRVRRVGLVSRAQQVGPVGRVRRGGPVGQVRRVCSVDRVRRVGPVDQVRRVCSVGRVRRVSPVGRVRRIEPCRPGTARRPCRPGTAGLLGQPSAARRPGQPGAADRPGQPSAAGWNDPPGAARRGRASTQPFAISARSGRRQSRCSDGEGRFRDASGVEHEAEQPGLDRRPAKPLGEGTALQPRSPRTACRTRTSAHARACSSLGNVPTTTSPIGMLEVSAGPQRSASASPDRAAARRR